VETRDDMLKRAFALAHERTVAALGADRAAWQWGKLHVANFVSNPMGASGIELIENMFNRSSEGVSGGTEIVNATGYNVGAGDFALSSLPSLRMIVDFSDLDASQSMHTTGQSAHPFSDYYANLIPQWTGLTYKPMLFTRGAVDAAAKHRLTLTP
jgi:penicillin amidase